MLLADGVWSEMVTDGVEGVSLDVRGIVVVVAGFRDIGTCCGKMDGVLELLDLPTKFWRDTALSDKETACLKAPVCLSSYSPAAFVSWVLGCPGTSFDVVYTTIEAVEAFWPLNVA